VSGGFGFWVSVGCWTGQSWPGRWLASWVREVMPSFLNTLPRWYSTVPGLMNSCAPISLFVKPSDTDFCCGTSY
jgi:hypothetical protein